MIVYLRLNDEKVPRSTDYQQLKARVDFFSLQPSVYLPGSFFAKARARGAMETCQRGFKAL
jgi:hypothetical protein